MKSIIKLEPARGDNAKVNMVIGFYFTIKTHETRKKMVKHFMSENLKNGKELQIVMTCCNGKFTFTNVESFPLVDTPCPCGAENRFLVKFHESIPIDEGDKYANKDKNL